MFHTMVHYGTPFKARSSVQTVAVIIKNAAWMASIKENEAMAQLSAHSLRVGLVTTAADCGIPVAGLPLGADTAVELQRPQKLGHHYDETRCNCAQIWSVSFAL